MDKLIGQADGFFSLGELHYLWERGLGENQVCECGTPVQECPFWGEVLSKAYAGEPLPDGFALEDTMVKNIRLRRLPALLRPGKPDRELDRYADHVGRILRAVHHASGGRILVDSSKNPLHGLLLCRLPDVKVHVLHLVRDMRAVGYSWKKRAKWRPDAHTHFPSRGFANSCAGWVVSNVLAEHLGKRTGSYTRLRYEDLVASVAPSLQRVLAELFGREIETTFIRGDRVSFEVHHMVAGNPVRLQHGDITIRPDETWREGLRGREKALILLLTWTWMRRYDYL